MKLHLARRIPSTLNHGRHVLAGLALLLAAATPAKAQSCTTATVNTPAGPICGTVSQGAGSTSANAFLGIRYAPHPGRWQVAQKAQPFTSTYQATQYGNICPQAAAPAPVANCTKTAPPAQSEDCLFLNVWVPTGTSANAKLPVKVFIHGGAFIEGAGSSPLYDGTYLAATSKVIVVSFNYRLGAFGFLALDGLTDSTSNNYGFRDQILALQWVQTNIGSFGGDSGNVTLWGESAGAMSVGLHALSSSQSAGLFHAAVMESNPLALPYQTIAEAETVGAQFAQDIGCTSGSVVDCLRGKSVADLLAAEFAGDLTANLNGLAQLLAWMPAIDQGSWQDPLLVGQPLNGALSVPMLLGSNQDEGILFVLALMKAKHWDSIGWLTYMGVLDNLFGSDTSSNIRAIDRYKCGFNPHCEPELVNVFTDYIFSCPNRYLGGKVAEVHNGPSLYAYYFTQVTNFNFWPSVPACNGKVCHGDELPYVFDTPTAVCQQDAFTTAELGLSKAMGGYWASFDKSHAPAGSVPWTSFGAAKNTMQLQVNPSIVTDPLGSLAQCSFWDQVGYEPSTAWTRLLALAAAD